MTRICLALLVAWLCPFASGAHEVRPAFLELKASGGDVYAVLWKTPMRGDARLALQPVFAGDTAMITPVLTRTPRDAAIQTWTMRAPSLRGQQFASTDSRAR